ncbi:NAD(P)-dependent oxidoreductase, partial [bacterium]|nr:NAD(P)-dependent oxidoreductase [bacterium]
EDGAYEARPKERGFYSYSKMERERWVHEFISRNEMPTVILRPATIFGPGGPIMTPLIGISAFNKLFVTLGKEAMRLPLVYIDNLIDAILLSMDKEDVKGEVFNVIDDKGITKKDYINDYVRRIFPKSWSIFLPYWFVYLAVFAQEILFGAIGKAPVLTRYRLTSASNEVRYDNSKAKTNLGWTSKISVREGLDRTFGCYKENL